MAKIRNIGLAAMALFAAAGITGASSNATSGYREPPVHFVAEASAQADMPQVTIADVRESNKKVAMAHAALASMWKEHFTSVGSRFAVPGLVRYQGSAPSSCGMMRPNNAGYCPTDNTIYFDEVFVAAQAKAAARQLGTDGDMAAVGIIAAGQ